MRTLVIFTVALAALPASAAAQQIPFSQRGTVSQRVGFTDVAVTYSRPTARGRTLFGGVVAWGRVWTPGADSATTIRFEHDVTVEDAALAAGRYTIWMIPRAERAWTVILSRAVDIFHTPYPGEERDAARFTVQPERGGHMETLAFYFPVVSADSAVLRMHWGGTIVPLRIRAPWRPEEARQRRP